MMRSLILAAVLGASTVLAADKCDLDNKCPKDSPCCSQFGECGVGAYCLGGCDPRMSYSFDACVPEPVCEDIHTKFDSMDSILDIGDYLGDPSKADWISQGEPRIYKDSLLLTMPKNSVGSLISSSTYMWYGNVKAKIKTSRGKGVITAFILFSDVKDEIDYEWVGADLETAQTNFYFQGNLDWHNSDNITLSNTFYNYHEYEIQWTPDTIKWLVDGQVGRTLDREDTWNKTTNQWDYPQTPARVQFSLWPGGLASNAPGTIAWAGGEIDWDSQDIEDAGYYYATIEEISVECYNAKSPPGTNDNKSYYYNEGAGTNDTVVDSNKDTVLGSLTATGLDMDKGKKDKESSTKSSDSSKETDSANTIPGGSNGSTGDDHSGDDDKDSSSDDSSSDDTPDSSSDSGDDSSSTSKADTKNCDPSSFSMDCDSDSSTSSDASTDDGDSGSSKASASALAIIVAGCALYWL